MPRPIAPDEDSFDLSFKVFHELMANKVASILLVSSPYDAFIMEEDGRLAERIIHEYQGLNLSRPPMLTWASSAAEALQMLAEKPFDLVIAMPRLGDMDGYALGRQIKQARPGLPVILLSHDAGFYRNAPGAADRTGIDNTFVWRGSADLLLALIKMTEDRRNVAFDTQRAEVRVIIVVEDDPMDLSVILPCLYREIVSQTQAVMEDTLNDEHRILRMRARPKILVAEDFENAQDLCQRYRPYLLCVICDMRFARRGRLDEQAGLALLQSIRKQIPDMALLCLSADDRNRSKAEACGAFFVNKTSPRLLTDIRRFLQEHLGFGDFIFRLPDGTPVARAANLREMEQVLASVPDESISYHALRNHFSTWLRARSEVVLASRLRPIKVSDFKDAAQIKRFLAETIHRRRRGRQRGIITQFQAALFDPEADFVKIGKGSLGGKARGLAFVLTQIKQNPMLLQDLVGVTIGVPQTLVISTEGFDAFVEENRLKDLAGGTTGDEAIQQAFVAAPLPAWLSQDLRCYLAQAARPLAVRSSSLREDAQFQACAGLYRTCMIANNDSSDERRLAALETAVKLVFASTYLAEPRAFAQSSLHRLEEEKMAVIVQPVAGSLHHGYFYPAVSGLAQSFNYYPIGPMKPDDGIAHIALGLGKTVVEGGQCLRFSPLHPGFLPQFSTVDDILANAQRHFFALNLNSAPPVAEPEAAMTRLLVDQCTHHGPVRLLAGAFSADDHRIRDAFGPGAVPVLTFAALLKYRQYPLAEVLAAVLEIGRQGLAAPVEIEFAVDFPDAADAPPMFNVLQIRPMAFHRACLDVQITAQDIAGALCYSHMALGNGVFDDIADVIYVIPEAFEPGRTPTIAADIGRFNTMLDRAQRRCLLIGPGRWGTADPWLGIPVRWRDISTAAVIIEAALPVLQADPSRGTHLFHNLTAMGIGYLTVAGAPSFIRWEHLGKLPAAGQTTHVRHLRLSQPLTVKIDGKTSRAAVLQQSAPPSAGWFNPRR